MVDPGVTAVELGRPRCLYRGLPGEIGQNRVDGRLEDRHPGVNTADPGVNTADPGVNTVPTRQTPAPPRREHGRARHTPLPTR